MTEEKRTVPKQQLEIAQAPAEKGYGTSGKTLVVVNAKNLSLTEGDPLIGKAPKYTVFNADLKDYILKLEVGTRFLCDIEERERPDTEYGPDRNIIQIYVNNEPVSKKKQGGGGGGYRRTLEEDLALEAVKRRSIEGQTSIAQVGERLADILKVPSAEWPRHGLDETTWKRVLGKYWQAVETGLDNFLAGPPSKLHPVIWEPASNTADKHQDAKSDAPPKEKVQEDAGPNSDPLKNVGDLLTRAHKRGASQRDVFSIAEVGTADELKEKDLEVIWAKIDKAWPAKK